MGTVLAFVAPHATQRNTGLQACVYTGLSPHLDVTWLYVGTKTAQRTVDHISSELQMQWKENRGEMPLWALVIQGSMAKVNS